MLELKSGIWPNVTNVLSEGDAGLCRSKKHLLRPDTWEEGRGAVNGQEEARELFAGKDLEKGASRHLGDDGPPRGCRGRMRVWWQGPKVSRQSRRTSSRALRSWPRHARLGFGWSQIRGKQESLLGPGDGGLREDREGHSVQPGACCFLIPSQLTFQQFSGLGTIITALQIKKLGLRSDQR